MRLGDPNAIERLGGSNQGSVLCVALNPNP